LAALNAVKKGNNSGIARRCLFLMGFTPGQLRSARAPLAGERGSPTIWVFGVKQIWTMFCGDWFGRRRRLSTRPRADAARKSLRKAL
jgi:hypothetical protein